MLRARTTRQAKSKRELELEPTSSAARSCIALYIICSSPLSAPGSSAEPNACPCSACIRAWGAYLCLRDGTAERKTTQRLSCYWSVRRAEPTKRGRERIRKQKHCRKRCAFSRNRKLGTKSYGEDTASHPEHLHGEAKTNSSSRAFVETYV